MSTTGLEVFDKTLHTTNIWLDEVMDTVGPDRKVAWHVLGAVIRTLRDRLPLPVAANLGAQLPLIVRGAYFDQFRPDHHAERIDTVEAFIAHVTADLGHIRPVNVLLATHAVLAVLMRHVSAGQIEKVKECLPTHLRSLWSQPSK